MCWMRSRFHVCRDLLFVACLAASTAAGQDPASQPSELHTIDRIVAVVDEDPIFQSEIEQAIALGLVERRDGESLQMLRRRVLDQLVDQRLRFQEMGRFGERTVTVEEIEAAVAAMRADFPDQQAFEEHLRAADTSPDELRQLIARQLAAIDFVDRRLGVRVFISLEDIQSYYDDELVPEMRRQEAPVPPLDEVREQIREVLRQRRLNEEIESWTEELRRQADVQILIDDYPDELPPVQLRIDHPSDSGGLPDGS